MNNPVFVIATPGSIVHTDLLLMLEMMIFIWWPFWRKQIVHAFWVGLIGLQTAFSKPASLWGPWVRWLVDSALGFCVQNRRATGKHGRYLSPSHPAQQANSQAYTWTNCCSFHQSRGAGEMRPVVPIRLADFFSSALDFCFQSSIRESVSLEGV